jgi:hypothetical protein
MQFLNNEGKRKRERFKGERETVKGALHLEGFTKSVPLMKNRHPRPGFGFGHTC